MRACRCTKALSRFILVQIHHILSLDIHECFAQRTEERTFCCVLLLQQLHTLQTHIFTYYKHELLERQTKSSSQDYNTIRSGSKMHARAKLHFELALAVLVPIAAVLLAEHNILPYGTLPSEKYFLCNPPKFGS